MVIDCHVNVTASTPAHGGMSQKLVNSIAFRFMRWRLDLGPYGAGSEDELERVLVQTIRGTEKLDAAVVLAFDAVYTSDGAIDETNTHLYVTNDYVIELAKRHPREILFGASVHPYRKDAVAELERCVAAGAVLLKWLPITQDIDPADPRCFPFYEALAHHKLPLLSHTGGEKSLPNLNLAVADPKLLVPALERGVTVIAAHCGTRSAPGEVDYVPEFVRMAHRYEHFYGDTSALNLPTRSYAYESILKDRVVREKLVHGSDWPIPVIPPVMDLGLGGSLAVMGEKNWMRRDVLIKERLGFDEAYWQRAATVLRLGDEGSSTNQHEPTRIGAS
jgi:predicted TIM-barrel fold metal-dependent hydrolase